MKLRTIALAITFALPSTYALAKGGMSGISMQASHSLSAAGRIANRLRNFTGNTLAAIAHDPSGSTISGSAMNRTGGLGNDPPRLEAESGSFLVAVRRRTADMKRMSILV
jgi:hypothetical protein